MDPSPRHIAEVRKLIGTDLPPDELERLARVHALLRLLFSQRAIRLRA